MNLEENIGNKKYLALVILTGIVFVFIFIFLMIFIWTRPVNKEEKTNTEDKTLGYYTDSKFEFSDQVNEYYNVISAMLSSNEVDQLYELLDEEFIKFNSFDKESFRKYLTNKKLSGKSFELQEYKNTSFRGNKVIKLSLRSNDSSNTNLAVTILEKSPNDYTICFDNLIAYISEDKNYENNGVKITLSNQSYFSNEYKANIKIINTSSSNIVLNKQKAAEIIYINQGENLNTLVSNNILMGQPLTIEPNQSINYQIRFLISDFTFANVKKLIIKDVTNESTGNTQDIEFDISI